MVVEGFGEATRDLAGARQRLVGLVQLRLRPGFFRERASFLQKVQGLVRLTEVQVQLAQIDETGDLGRSVAKLPTELQGTGQELPSRIEISLLLVDEADIVERA